jgi:hypothetical protein
MNLLQFLTSIFSNPDNSKVIFKLLSDVLNGNFNLINLLNGIDIEKALSLIAPIFQNNNLGGENKKSGFSLTPIENFANKDIVYTLNKYFENN